MRCIKPNRIMQCIKPDRIIQCIQPNRIMLQRISLTGAAQLPKIKIKLQSAVTRRIFRGISKLWSCEKAKMEIC